MEDQKHGQLMREFGNLEGLVRGVLNHLATLNGSVKEQSTNHANLKERVDKWEGARNVFSTLWGVIIGGGGLLVAIITLVAYFFKN